MNVCHFGDCRDTMKRMIAASVRVNMICTSPPYWRQRDYGVAGQLGLEKTPEEYVANIVEVFRIARDLLSSDGTLWLNIGEKWASGGHGGGGSYMDSRADAWSHAKDAKGWRNPPVGYKDKDLIGVPWMLAFALRADGWYLRQCNIWAKPNCMPESVSDRSTAAHEYVFQLSKSNDYFYDAEAARTPATPSTDTRLAQDIEQQAGSARANGGGTRPMKAGGRLTGSPHGRHALGDNIPENERRTDKQRGHTRRHAGFNDRWDAMERQQQQQYGANLRSVWWISPAQYQDTHFAVMPERLAEICVVAGTSSHGHCPDCGFGWERIVARGAPDMDARLNSGGDAQGEYHGTSHKYRDDSRAQNASTVKARVLDGMRERVMVGWYSTCKCYGVLPLPAYPRRPKNATAEQLSDWESACAIITAKRQVLCDGVKDRVTVPAVVLDPFMGSGTTGQVAQDLGRRWLGCELNPAYAPLQKRRTEQLGLVL